MMKPSVSASTLLWILGCSGFAAAEPGLPSASSQRPATVDWLHGSFPEALAQAEAKGHGVMLYFWMDGSQHCSDLFSQTLEHTDVAKPLESFVCLSADARTPQGSELVQRFGVTSLPTLLFTTPEGVVDDAILGFIPVAAFLAELQRIQSGVQTVTAMRNDAGATPDDLDKRYALARKLEFVGLKEEALNLDSSIRQDDPDGQSAAGANLLILEVRDELLANSSDATDPNTWDLAPLEAALKRIGHGPSRFQGWNWLADSYGRRGDRKNQRASWQNARKDIPPGGIGAWTAIVLATLWNQRDELDRKDKSFAFELAKIAQKEAEKQRAEEQAAAGGDPASPPVEEEEKMSAASLLAAAAQGQCLAGKKKMAGKLVEQALAWEPTNEELVRIRDEIKGPQRTAKR